MKFWYFLLPSLLLAGPALPLDEDRLNKLVNLICENGGYIYEEAAAALLPQYGYTKDEVQELETALLERDLVDQSASVKKGAIVLANSACS